MSLSEVFNRDCMEALREYPDNFFDLACVDPPYGISVTARHKAKPEDGGVQLVGSARPFGGKRTGTMDADPETQAASPATETAETAASGSTADPTTAAHPSGGGVIQMTGASKSFLTRLRFTMRSTTAPRRTRSISGSCSGSVRIRSFGAGTSFWTISGRRPA